MPSGMLPRQRSELVGLLIGVSPLPRLLCVGRSICAALPSAASNRSMTLVPVGRPAGTSEGRTDRSLVADARGTAPRLQHAAQCSYCSLAGVSSRRATSSRSSWQRGLGPADYGIYGVVMSLLLWAEMFSGAGIPAATAQLLSRHQRRRGCRRAYCTRTAPVCRFSALRVVLGIAPSVARLLDITDGSTLIRVAILDLPFNGVYLAYQGLLNGQRRFGALSVTFVIYAVTKLVGTLLLVRTGLR